MAGGGKVRICDRDNTGEMARVVNGRLLVTGDGGGGGGGNVTIVAPLPLPVDIAAQSFSPLTVTATQSGVWTVAVNNFPATQDVEIVAPLPLPIDIAAQSVSVTVNDGGGALTVDGTVNVGNFPATQPVSGTVAVGPTVTPGTGAANLGKADEQTHLAGDVGVMALAVRSDVDVPFSVDGAYTPILSDAAGRLKVVGTVVVSGGTIGVTAVGAVIPGTAAANLGKAEDAIHASGDTGVFVLAVRNDAGTALAADGDYIGLTTDANGALRVTGTVAVSGPVTVTGTVAATQSGAWTVAVNNFPATQPVSGTVAVSSITTSVTPGTAAANLGKAEDAIHNSGDVGVMALAVRQDTPTALGANGDYVPLTTTSANALRVDASVAALSVTNLQPGSGPLNLGKLEDGPHSSGDLGVMALAVRNDSETSLAGTTLDYAPLQVTALGRLKVDAILTDTRLILSASTGGEPITLTAAQVTMHAVPSNTTDQVTIYVTNTSSTDRQVTLRIGTTQTILVFCPANETVIAIEGIPVVGSRNVQAMADVTSVVNLFGYVVRQAA